MSHPTFGTLSRDRLALFTDLYALTMTQGYVETGHAPRATADRVRADLESRYRRGE